MVQKNALVTRFVPLTMVLFLFVLYPFVEGDFYQPAESHAASLNSRLRSTALEEQRESKEKKGKKGKEGEKDRQKSDIASGRPLIWRAPSDIERRDLFYGIGGRSGAPDP